MKQLCFAILLLMIISSLNPEGGLTVLGGIIPGVIALFCLIITLLTIMRAIKHTEGTALPVWILLIIFVMPLGGIIALVAIKPKVE